MTSRWQIQKRWRFERCEGRYISDKPFKTLLICIAATLTESGAPYNVNNTSKLALKTNDF